MSAARVASNTSPPLNSMPSSAARPVPVMMAAGVANPSAHGQAMMSTATECSIASPADRVGASRSHPANVAAAMAITTGTKTDETRSATRWTGAFDPCAASSSRTISASLEPLPTVVTKTTRRPLPLIVEPTTSSPGPTSTGADSPVMQREVDPRRAFLHDAVDGDRLPGSNHHELTRPYVVDRR